jgi:SHS2 domain-containing protein
MKDNNDTRGERVAQFDHTGDLGIEVTAGTLARLFELAAQGMFGLLTDVATIRDSKSVHIQVEASDRAALMVRWLSELNFVHLTEGLLFARFDLESIDDYHLDAVAWGEPFDPGRHPMHTEIKAVTFHDLLVEERNGGWHARIIFDI